MKKEVDMINDPPHYKAIFGADVVCNDISGALPFNLGNIVKYAWRLGLKGKAEYGDWEDDYNKIQWYLGAYTCQVCNEDFYKAYLNILKEARKKFRTAKDVLKQPVRDWSDYLLHAKYIFIRDVLYVSTENVTKKIEVLKEDYKEMWKALTCHCLLDD